MIEINFFERKEKNVLPHLMVLFFLVGLTAISAYFYMMHGLYIHQDLTNSQLMQQHSEELALSREMDEIQRATAQNRQAMATLENGRYPIVYLTGELADVIPSEEDVVVQFQLVDTDEVLVQIDNNEIVDSSELIVQFEQLPYVTRVNVNRLEQQSQEGEDYVIDITLDIDEALLREAAAE